MPKMRSTKATDQETAPATAAFRSYNRVQVAGRLVAAPELHYTDTGKAVCRMRVATNDTRAAQFHDIVAWEELAEKAATTLGRGATAVIEGRLQTRTWQAPDGSSRRATEIVAASITA